ncbi:MAG: cation diffusion facilitator family transporter [Proteobacteria bacterium]|nr:cation diffusion facilitator family transporter [Pseudomonadota bacterium]
MSPTKRMAMLSIATSIATLALKFGAYAMTDSMGLLSDALEALVNLAAGLVAFGVLSVAERPADEDHAYGHEKAEYFSSGVEGVLILVAAVAIVYAGVGRLFHPAELVHLGPGLVVAALAGGMNFVTARLMLQVAKQHDSIVIEADAHHLMTDVVTSIGVIGGLLVVMLVPSARILDSLIAIGVAVHIGWTGVSLLRRSVDGLMDRSLPVPERAAVDATLRATLRPGDHVAELRTRKSGSRRFVEFKLYVPDEATVAAAHDACDELEAALGRTLAKMVVTIHVEPLSCAPRTGQG